MNRPFFRRSVAMAALAATTTATAAELQLGVDSLFTYNSNFFVSQFAEESATSVELGLSADLREDRERLKYRLRYDGARQNYFDQDDVDAWEHRLRGDFTYALDQRTEVRVRNRYRDVTNLRFNRDDIDLGDTGLEPNQDRYRRNDFDIRLERALSPRWSGSLDAAYQIIDFNQNLDRSDSDSLRLGGEVSYQLSSRQTLGLGAAWIRQSFEAGGARRGSDGEYTQLSLSYSYALSENTTLRLFGGPAWISSEEEALGDVRETAFVGGSFNGDLVRSNIGSCDFDDLLGVRRARSCDATTAGAPPIPAADLGAERPFALVAGPGAVNDDDLTFLGGFDFQSVLDDWRVGINLARTQNTTSGDALVSSLERAYFDVEYAPGNRGWSAYIAGSYERRENLTDATFVDFVVVPGLDDAAERDSAFTAVRDPDERRDAATFLIGTQLAFGPSFTASIEARYREVSRRIFGATEDGSAYLGVIEFRYTFNPIRL